ncbi:type IV secretion protein Rhs [Streptomyces mashuensis]|uniref:Type IV secretion protein Rhs n=1 Tax=Streptomyces mashuensis TaxID=33904 RepID=A0A919B992_9ACTN|nr:VgrG-related protein [Streptomyces mashuensis]GHF70346.1 type IV secretion protein Rhs [Streptomyces mashuensis]
MTERLYAAEPVVAFGSPLREEWAGRLVEAYVDTALGVPARATLRFRDPEHRLLTSAGIAVGVPLTVAVATALRRSRTGVFDGEVTALETEADADGTFTTVRAMDRGHRLMRGRRVAAHVETTVAEVAERLAARHGLKAGRIDAERTRIPHLAQPNLTDWELLNHLADERGLRLSVEGGTVHMRRPAAASGAPAPGTGADRSPFVLEYGENLLALRAAVSSEGQVAGVEVRGWDPQGKAALSTRAGAGDSDRLRLGVTPGRLGTAFPGPEPELLVGGRGHATAPRVDAAARALAQEAAAAMAQVSAEVVGTPELAAGVPVALTGVGEPFAGQYTVTSCRHSFDGDQGYRTLVGVGPLPPPVVPYPPPLCALGVAVGIVTDIKEPGQGQRGAVRLRLPWLSQEYVTDWVRTVQWGGAGGGGVFAPEAGDEVLVGFEHGRLDRPYVIGGLYNGVDGPTDHKLPLVDAGTGRANRRSLASRAGDRLELLSATDGPQGVRLRTGDGKLDAHLDRKDSTIALTAGDGGGGATLRISLDARGNGTLTVDAGPSGRLVLTAGTVEITGGTVTVTSDGDLTLGGQRTTVTGNTVDIN